MTYYKAFTFECDKCGVTVHYVHTATAGIARGSLTRIHGWTNKGRRDYCKKCSKKLAKDISP